MKTPKYPYQPLTKLKHLLVPGTSTQTDQIPTPLADLLQNFVLHLFAATQNPNKIYEQVSGVESKTSSTGFISETVKAQEAYSQKKKKKLHNSKKK